MDSSSTDPGYQDDLVSNPGFRLFMKKAAGWQRPLPESVLRLLAGSPYFRKILLEANNLDTAPASLGLQHFENLANDPRIAYLLQELLERHLRMRDRLKAVGSWMLKTAREWLESILGVGKAEPGGLRPKLNAASILVALVVGGGGFLAYNASSDVRDVKYQRYEDQRRLDEIRRDLTESESHFENRVQEKYWQDRHDFETRITQDLASKVSKQTAESNQHSSVIEESRKTQEQINVLKNEVTNSTQKIEKSLIDIEARVPGAFPLPPLNCGETNQKSSTTTTAYWAVPQCCCQASAANSQPSPTPAPSIAATYTRVDANYPAQNLDSHGSSSALFADEKALSGTKTLIVLYPVSDRGFDGCTMTLSGDKTTLSGERKRSAQDEPTSKPDRIYGQISECPSPELRGAEFEIPFALRKQWIFFPTVLAYARLDPLKRGWRVSVQAGPYALPGVSTSRKEDQATMRKTAAR